jgi:hypothetical protein
VDEEVFNMSIRKYLKKLGVTAQREIELAVRERVASGELEGDESLPVRATVVLEGIDHDIRVEGAIALS